MNVHPTIEKATTIYNYVTSNYKINSTKKKKETYAFKQTNPNFDPGALVNFSQKAKIIFSDRSKGIYNTIIIQFNTKDIIKKLIITKTIIETISIRTLSTSAS